jgi:hypothetical protein
VVLLDFGIAKLATEDGGGNTPHRHHHGHARLHGAGAVHGCQAADLRADLYALGCIPAHAGRPGAVHRRRTGGDHGCAPGTPPPPVGKEAQVSPGIEALVTRLMAGRA